MKNIVILLIISLIPAFFACEKTIHIDIPDNDPKPVAQAFLSPDDEYINVFLTWSVPLYHEFDWSFKDITDADVFIIKNGNKYKLDYINPQFQEENGYYEIEASKIVINPGDEINLEINTKNGIKVTGKTIIPVKPDFNLTLQKTDSMVNEGYYTYDFKFTAKNKAEYNYYRLNAIAYYSYTNNQTTYVDSSIIYTASDNPELYKIPQGNSIYIKYESYRYIDSLKISVLHTDEAYYEYHKSIWNFEGDNPFAEPVIIYSNIENGLGVFSSYNRSSETFKLK